MAPFVGTHFTWHSNAVNCLTKYGIDDIVGGGWIIFYFSIVQDHIIFY